MCTCMCIYSDTLDKYFYTCTLPNSGRVHGVRGIYSLFDRVRGILVDRVRVIHPSLGFETFKDRSS